MVLIWWLFIRGHWFSDHFSKTQCLHCTLARLPPIYGGLITESMGSDFFDLHLSGVYTS